MRMPEVLFREEEGDTLRVGLDILEELECFRGHFPSMSVLPGVVQLDWAVRVAREHFGLAGVPLDIQRLKFKSVVLPPIRIDLEITRTGPATVRFRYSSADAEYSEGRLAFPEPA